MVARIADRAYTYYNSVGNAPTKLLFRTSEGKLIKSYGDINPWAREILREIDPTSSSQAYSKWIEGTDKSNERGKIDYMFRVMATKPPLESNNNIQPIDSTGRGERIRTSDHLHPMQVRYQAALRPEVVDYSRATKCMKKFRLNCSSRDFI